MIAAQKLIGIYSDPAELSIVTIVPSTYTIPTVVSVKFPHSSEPRRNHQFASTDFFCRSILNLSQYTKPSLEASYNPWSTEMRT